jgi:hypothetical protein
VHDLIQAPGSADNADLRDGFVRLKARFGFGHSVHGRPDFGSEDRGGSDKHRLFGVGHTSLFYPVSVWMFRALERAAAVRTSSAAGNSTNATATTRRHSLFFF